ncbi:unnamed protein product [Acanthocheilonema viteae]|uniref:Uncharacterized protein n=1 Tax=Acanthocheilonema viteae TaxID=6277 RepID=A0A498SLG5_ACAVI|nr:unnamed protein product [Acanthocheilonema viteae]
MSTSERPLVPTKRTAIHRQQPLSSVTELPVTTNSSSSSGSLSSSTHPTTIQKPLSNFIDVIVAAFTALLLAWRLLLSNGEDKKDEIPVGLNWKDDDSSIKDIDGINGDATSATKSIASTAMESPSAESLKALLSTDSISDDRLGLTATTARQQHFLIESPQCSIQQNTEYFLRYGNNAYNTERYLLAIPELEEENDELCGSQWSVSSSSSLRAPTAILNTSFGAGTDIRSVSSNSDQPISFNTTATTDHAPDLINCYQPSNSSLVNLNQNPNPKFCSNQAIFANSSSHSTILHRPTSKPVLTVPHPTISPPPPPFSSRKPLLPPKLPHSKEFWNDTFPSSPPLSSTDKKVVATTTAGHLTFDIPGEYIFVED